MAVVPTGSHYWFRYQRTRELNLKYQLKLVSLTPQAERAYMKNKDIDIGYHLGSKYEATGVLGSNIYSLLHKGKDLSSTPRLLKT